MRSHDHHRIRHSERAKLIDGHGRAVVVHANLVEQADVGAAGAQTAEFLAEILDSFIHADFGLGHAFFGVVNGGHFKSSPRGEKRIRC